MNQNKSCVRALQLSLLAACSLSGAAAWAETVIASGPEQSDVRQLGAFSRVELSAPA